MAIKPIDLQTMYSQMNNVSSKFSLEQHGSQMSAAISQQASVLQDSQKVKTVIKTAENESKTGLVKDGSNKGQNQSSEKKKSQDEEENDSISDKIEFKEDFLGRHIDITR